MSNPWQKQPSQSQLSAGSNPFAEQPVNPYAAPLDAGYVTPPQPQAQSTDPFAGLWRQGDVLVMHKQAPLPNICIKSNQPATHRLKRSLYWHHPAVYLAILGHLLIYIIIALIVRKSATIFIPLTEEWYRRRQRRMLFSWLAILAGVGLIVAAAAVVNQNNTAVFGIIGGIFLMLGAAIYGLIACRLVTPKRMTDDYVWLKGVHPDFLARLEVWQWNI